MEPRISEQPAMLAQNRTSSQKRQDLEVVYQKLHQLQARLSRSVLSEAIKEFEENLQCLFHEAKLLLCTKREKYRQSWFASSVEYGSSNESRIIKASCCIIESTNKILSFLSFLEEKRGLPSGGDEKLQQAAYKGQQFAFRLLHSLKIHKDVQELPGRQFGLTYGNEVHVAHGQLVHRSKREVVGQPGGKNWHVDHAHHPLRHVPGTPWHKFFGNLELKADNHLQVFEGDTSVDSNQNGLQKVHVIIPETAEYILDEISTEHQNIVTINTEDGHAQPPAPTPVQHEARLRELDFAMATSFPGHVVEAQPEVVFHHEGLGQLLDHSQERQFSIFSNVFTRPEIWGEGLELGERFETRDGVQQEEHIYYI